MKKEVVKVPFDGKRYQDFVRVSGENNKIVAADAGCSDSTIRKAVKTGVINEVYVEKIAAHFSMDVAYFKGEKTDYYTRLARAVRNALNALDKLNSILAEE